MRPDSDVSGIVGFLGLGGLLAWVVFCRSFPEIGAYFGWQTPRVVLSGPFSALAAILWVALPMVLYEVGVAKVHRRASAGLDWDNPRPWAENFTDSLIKIFSLFVSFAVIAAFYKLGRWYWDGGYIFSMQVLTVFALPIAALTIPYVLWSDRYLKERRDSTWHFGAMILGRKGWMRAEAAKHARSWAIKGFFTAFMISALPGGFAILVEADFNGILGDPVRLAELCITTLFVIDVQIGTVGYILTMRPLDAHIRSSNPFLGGWVAALICYPPIAAAFMFSGGMIHYEVNTPGWAYWLGGNNGLLYIWGAALVTLTALYAWATMAFGIRFSNLTYRGVITNGPYRFTRHPAYVAKNLFWWLSTLPFLVTSNAIGDMVRNTFFLACVSGIYFWRAKTEEAHLLAEDAKYRAYHAWMTENGALTSRIVKLRRQLGSAMFWRQRT